MKPTYEQLYKDLAIRFVEFVKEGTAARYATLQYAALAYHHRTIEDKQLAEGLAVLTEGS